MFECMYVEEHKHMKINQYDSVLFYFSRDNAHVSVPC